MKIAELNRPRTQEKDGRASSFPSRRGDGRPKPCGTSAHVPQQSFLPWEPAWGRRQIRGVRVGSGPAMRLPPAARPRTRRTCRPPRRTGAARTSRARCSSWRRRLQKRGGAGTVHSQAEKRNAPCISATVSKDSCTTAKIKAARQRSGWRPSEEKSPASHGGPELQPRL